MATIYSIRPNQWRQKDDFPGNQTGIAMRMVPSRIFPNSIYVGSFIFLSTGNGTVKQKSSRQYGNQRSTHQPKLG
jgi:hypothetical protein